MVGAMGSALDAVTAHDARNFIEHRVYHLADQLLDRGFIYPSNLEGSQ
jgi:hypothetical protein